MYSEDTILIHGDPGRIYQLAADIQDWPCILPHYRYVVVEEQAETWKTARMGASRSGFPVRWRARQELRPDERRILFTHVGGITKGMDVEWRLQPEEDAVRVTIAHDLRYPVPLLGEWFADLIVGRLFIHHIAGRTLRRIKEIVECEARENAGSS